MRFGFDVSNQSTRVDEKHNINPRMTTEISVENVVQSSRFLAYNAIKWIKVNERTSQKRNF